ncbi:transposase [Candidatus Aerophobetes bacterium]|nr:transposase [Candidatus Aerophobetes bacterium]
MPRTSRIILPDYPHHIIQRGHNRDVVFTSDEDYLYYLKNLKGLKQDLGCKVYAFCLMTNHYHLIVNPGKEAQNLALLMKHLSGRQTRYVNKVKKRRGTLWEGRYKSSPIREDEYLLACCRYVELNPVRAGMVDEPTKYKWSSYRHKVGLENLEWLDLDPCYNSLGLTEDERRKRYKEWVEGDIPEGEWEIIRKAVQRGQLTGSIRFVEDVARKIRRRIEFRGQGRPKKKK